MSFFGCTYDNVSITRLPVCFYLEADVVPPFCLALAMLYRLSESVIYEHGSLRELLAYYTMLVQASLLLLLSGSVYAGTTLWSGSFNPFPSVSAFDNCKTLSLALPH